MPSPTISIYQVFVPSDKLDTIHFSAFASLSIITAYPHLCLKKYVESSVQSRIVQVLLLHFGERVHIQGNAQDLWPLLLYIYMCVCVFDDNNRLRRMLLQCLAYG